VSTDGALFLVVGCCRVCCWLAFLWVVLSNTGSLSLFFNPVSSPAALSLIIIPFVPSSGRKGMPPVSAPLADPNAIPNESVQGIVDSCLRTICCAMLASPDDGTGGGDHPNAGAVAEAQTAATMKALATVIREGGADSVDATVASLSYLRDRVGVPRDMKLPAARQLRAHLNWAIGTLLQSDGV
jgi:hypothetical protein